VNEVAIEPGESLLPEPADWEQQARSMDFEEPPFDAEGSEPAAGAVVVEPDGRLWLVSPTNEYGGYKSTFPKGKAHGMSLKATALKEVFEEAGLRVELFSHLVDVTKTTSRTRYYLARRTGGNPAAMCWEVQAVHLVPLETAKELLNQPVDHQVIDALTERWGDWASWFFQRKHDDSAWEAAKHGRIPATRRDWPTLPLPVRRTRIPLDVRLDHQETENFKLGFVPRMMEQKWFAYFEGDTLHEHRSWTGFCISEVHFVIEGEGLRAVYADVNREPHQYSCTDDADDARSITERIRNLAQLTEAERNAEDPFVAAMKASLVRNYLGNPEVVHRLLETFFRAMLDHQIKQARGKSDAATYQACMDACNAVARAFAGEDPDYAVIGSWNSEKELGAVAVRTLGLDPAYYADENLFCILSEGLAGVWTRVREMFTAFLEDPRGDFEEDLLPRLGELLHFTASVLMGTHSVLFPGRVLKDFGYVPEARQTSLPGLFDGAVEDEVEDEDEDEDGDEMTPQEIRELRRAFGLPDPEEADRATAEAVASELDDSDLDEISKLRKAFGLDLYEDQAQGASEVQAKHPQEKKPGRPITLPGPIGALAKKVGGVSALAQELGVPVRTVRRWANGSLIPKMALKVLGQLFEQHAINPVGITMGPAEE
jgi:8-oxo-dGTP pyrophosphatase MutT (NUDIX family)/DNA-binding transcriptional regulator YiaG